MFQAYERGFNAGLKRAGELLGRKGMENLTARALAEENQRLKEELKEAQEGADTVYADMNRIVPELHAEIKALKHIIEILEADKEIVARSWMGVAKVTELLDENERLKWALQEATERVSVVTARQWMRLELLERVKVAEARAEQAEQDRADFEGRADAMEKTARAIDAKLEVVERERNEWEEMARAKHNFINTLDAKRCLLSIRADGYLEALKEILAGTHDNDQEVKEGHFCAGCIAREAIKAGESK